MNYLIVGDVHGCLHTFEAMLDHWSRKTEMLNQVGDLIDRGNFVPEVVQRARQLQNEGENCLFLRGNHEMDAVLMAAMPEFNNWLLNGGKETMKQYEDRNFSLEADVKWFSRLPLFFETEQLMVSHAGISRYKDAFDEFSNNGLLWTRGPLKRLEKIQVHGHTPHRTRNPHFDPQTNAWNVDTGACYGFGLSGLRISDQGEILDKIYIPTFVEDIQKIG